MKPEIEPAAIVKSAASEIVAKIIAIDKQLIVAEKKTVDDWINMGQFFIDLYKEVGRDNFLAQCELTGIPQQRRSEATKFAKLPRAVISKCSCVSDLRKAIFDQKEESAPAATEVSERKRCRSCNMLEPYARPAKCKACDALNHGPEQEQKPLSNMPSSFCKACQNAPRKNCPQCARLRGETPTVTVSSNKTKPGDPIFSWKDNDLHYGKVMRSLDDLAKKYPEVKQMESFAKAGASLEDAAKHFADIRQMILGGRRK